MLINFQKDFPEVTSFDMIASGNTGSGLIKSVSRPSKYFCDHKDCYYTVKLRMNNIREVVFLPTVFDNGSEIKVKNSLAMNEEIEIGEILYYKLILDNPGKNDVLFTIYPRHSQTLLYVNPEEELKDLKAA